MDEKFMREALKQAKKAALAGETPIGAVIVHGGTIIARAYNKRETKKNALSHAQSQSRRDRTRGNFRDKQGVLTPRRLASAGVRHVRNA